MSAIADRTATAFDVLRCPACRSLLETTGAALKCSRCAKTYPIDGGIPRFVTRPADELARRTQASFGYEWSTFDDWAASGEANFQQYFGDVDLDWLRGRNVLDAGCGMGRHARQIAPHAGSVVAMDFSQAIEAAKRNTSGLANVLCVQGDITDPPVADDAFDFVYSVGVLHHLADTESAARTLLTKVKPGGRFRLYLYWKRRGVSAAVLRGVDAVRTISTRLPFPILKALSWILSVGLWLCVVLPYKALAAMGSHLFLKWPLALYQRYPFNVLYNDQFDRFSAPIERRWSEDEVRALMSRLGLVDVRVTPAFGWIAQGTKPSR